MSYILIVTYFQTTRICTTTKRKGEEGAIVQTRTHLTFSITLTRNSASCQDDFMTISFRSSVCRYIKLLQRTGLAHNILGYFN